jgi:hypothetical protein
MIRYFTNLIYLIAELPIKMKLEHSKNDSHVYDDFAEHTMKKFFQLLYFPHKNINRNYRIIKNNANDLQGTINFFGKSTKCMGVKTYVNFSRKNDS